MQYATPGGWTRMAAHQLICGAVQVQAEAIPEEVAWHMPELHSDLCAPALQGFASLEQEGNAIPPSVVDEERHCRECGT